MAERIEFLGQFDCTIDAKKRTTLPRELRAQLGKDFCAGVTLSMDAVALYPKVVWDALMFATRQVSKQNVGVMQYLRMFRANAFAGQNYDAQGRIVLPEPLVGFIGLGTGAVYLGNDDHIEICDKERFEREKTLVRGSAASIVEEYLQPRISQIMEMYLERAYGGDANGPLSAETGHMLSQAFQSGTVPQRPRLPEEEGPESE